MFIGAAQGKESYTDVFANTVLYASVRLMLSMGAMRDWEMFNVDIRGAFLAAQIDTELYMEEPAGRETLDDQGRKGGIQDDLPHRDPGHAQRARPENLEEIEGGVDEVIAGLGHGSPRVSERSIRVRG